MAMQKFLRALFAFCKNNRRTTFRTIVCIMQIEAYEWKQKETKYLAFPVRIDANHPKYAQIRLKLIICRDEYKYKIRARKLKN